MVTSQATNANKVAVALSGGVDSSTAAALLLEQGYQVMGMTMSLWATRFARGLPENECCSASAIADAQRVCEFLGIPFHLVDLETPFKAHVVEYFCDSYALGHTPNPCLPCNRHIKFGALLQRALEWGADFLATGHYARIRTARGEHQLLKASDPDKDQSYVLYMLGQEELGHVMFPLGSFTKPQVRAMAAVYGLPTADRTESQDACFLSDGDYRAFLAQRRPETQRPGPIFDLDGRQLGEHRGIAFYTVGQRRGLGIAAPHALYVLEIDAARNSLIVGPKAAVFRHECWADDVVYVSGKVPQASLPITAKIRYRAPEASATLLPAAGYRARVVFVEPQPAITPGQGIVFYQGSVVLGGGVIAASG